MKSDEIHYYHLRIGHGVTFAYRIEGEDWVQFSYAICSKRDQYCKAIGRSIATHRLFHKKQNKVSGFAIDPDTRRFEVIRLIVHRFLTDVMRKDTLYIKSPSWLRRLVGTKTAPSFVSPVTTIVNTLFPIRSDSLKAV